MTYSANYLLFILPVDRTVEHFYNVRFVICKYFTLCYIINYMLNEGACLSIRFEWILSNDESDKTAIMCHFEVLVML